VIGGSIIISRILCLSKELLESQVVKPVLAGLFGVSAISNKQLVEATKSSGQIDYPKQDYGIRVPRTCIPGI
jgi:hypothetical protein